MWHWYCELHHSFSKTCYFHRRCKGIQWAIVYHNPKSWSVGLNSQNGTQNGKIDHIELKANQDQPKLHSKWQTRLEQYESFNVNCKFDHKGSMYFSSKPTQFGQNTARKRTIDNLK
eukprot:338180_1